MDYLAACYTAVGHWGLGADETFTMRWYHAAPGAKVYPFPHAFASSLFLGCQNDEEVQIGEQNPHWRDVSPREPSLYDGSEEPVFNPALLYGADPRVMAVGCVDGSMTFVGSATTGFGPVTYTPSVACSCSGVLQP